MIWIITRPSTRSASFCTFIFLKTSRTARPVAIADVAIKLCPVNINTSYKKCNIRRRRKLNTASMTNLRQSIIFAHNTDCWMDTFLIVRTLKFSSKRRRVHFVMLRHREALLFKKFSQQLMGEHFVEHRFRSLPYCLTEAIQIALICFQRGGYKCNVGRRHAGRSHFLGLSSAAILTKTAVVKWLYFPNAPKRAEALNRAEILTYHLPALFLFPLSNLVSENEACLSQFQVMDE